MSHVAFVAAPEQFLRGRHLMIIGPDNEYFPVAYLFLSNPLPIICSERGSRQTF